MKYAVISDSGCGYSRKELDAWGIYCLPLQIFCEDQYYLDGMDMDIEGLYHLLKEKKLIKTSQPCVGMIEELIEKLKEEYDGAIVVPLSKGLSSTGEMIERVGKSLNFPIYLIDCYTAGFVEGYVARCAKILIEQGETIENIMKCLNRLVRNSHTFIIPDSLDQLKRGGRLTPLAATLAGLLKIKPILLADMSTLGRIDIFKKIRTMRKAIVEVVNQMPKDASGYEIFIMHSEVEDHIEYIKSLMEEHNCKVYVKNIPAVLASHTGMGCVIIQFIPSL